MAERAQLVDLGRRLQAAAARQDWSTVADIDREVAACLGTLRADRLSASAQQALAVLQQVHSAVRLQCDSERARLGERPLNREGWLAYARNGALREEPV